MTQSLSPIPVTVLSGFLGSGKTTLLNVLLRAPHGRRIAVIVNEFGEVGIDGALVPEGEQFVELDNGCLCCALNEDLVTTLEQLVARGNLDHVVIETTGLADPLPVAWTCTRPSLSQKLRVDAIVTVVDARGIARAFEESTEARAQVSRADILLLNKLDLAPQGASEARAACRAINPEAPILDAVQANVPWHLLMGDDRDGARLGAALTQSDEGVHAHASAYETYSYRLPDGAVIPDERIETLAYAVPESVFRFKGLLRVDSEEGPYLLVNGVAGRIDFRFMAPAAPPETSAMVFIGRALDREALRALCARTLLDPAP